MIVICSHFNEMSKYQDKVAGGMHGSRPRTVSSPIPLQRSPRPVSPGQHFVSTCCMISLLLITVSVLSDHQCPSVCLCLSSICLSVCSLSVCLSVCHLSVCLSVCYLSLHVSACLSVSELSVHLSVCLSVCHNGGPCQNSSRYKQ